MGNRSISNRLWRLADRETRAARFDLAGVVAQFQRIELKSQSKSPVSQGVARSGKTQWHPYCSQTLINAKCGTTNIVAAPVLYQQGTRTFSGIFNAGTSQSYSAQAVAPPNPRGYIQPLLLWGIPICFTFFWAFVGLFGILNRSKSAISLGNTVTILLLLGVACVGGMLLSFRRIASYNREVYPRLHWNWEHTYICRRCGKFRLIPS